MNILMKKVSNYLSSPCKKLVAIMPDLLELSIDLETISMFQPLDGIVFFFNKMSEWKECKLGEIIQCFVRVNCGQHDDVVRLLRKLEKHFVEVWQDSNVIYLAKQGETVVPENILLGGIRNLNSHNIPYWNCYKSFPKMEKLNAYEVVSIQAAEFMELHSAPICNIIDQLNGYILDGYIKKE